VIGYSLGMIKAIIFDCFGVLISEGGFSLLNGNITNEKKNIELLSYIAELKKDYKIAMLSNVNNAQSLFNRFESNEIKLFDEVVASGDIGFAKPQAQAFEIVADMLGVRCDECVMIDDRQDYCMGARASGMKTILYESLEQTKNEIQKLVWCILGYIACA